VESSAYSSSLPPPSDRPGLARAYPRSDSYDRATPRELKAEAIRLRELTGLGKRETARLYDRPWETVRGWLDPRALDRTPPIDFVRWLLLRVELELLTTLEREARSR
jgi:hypothetical protein